MQPHVDSVASVVGREAVGVLVAKGYVRGGVARKWSNRGLTAFSRRGAYRRPPVVGMNSVARKLVQL